MKNISFASLRIRLMLLILAVIVPMLGLIVYHGIDGRNRERLDALATASRMARNAAALYENTVMETRQILFTLSHIPHFRQQDPATCAKIFVDLLKTTENYNAFSAAKPNGEVFASAPSMTKPVSYADRPWFQRLIQNHSFIIGEYLIGRISGKPMVVLGYPVLDHTGQLIAVFAAGLDLERLQQKILKINLPEGANLTVIGGNGTVLLRYPDPEKFAGKPMPESSIVKTILTKKEGTEEGVGLDGVPSLYGYTTVGSGVEAIYISVGIPEQVAYANLKRRMARDLTLLGLVSVLALLGAWLFGGILIISPVNRLIDVTKQLADGDLTIRTSRSTDAGELGVLSSHFDQMAGALQRREEALRASEEKYRLHFENVSDVIFSLDREFRILSVSPSLERVSGYRPEEFIGKSFPELNILPPEHLEKAFSNGMRVFAGENIDSITHQLIARDGTRKYIEFSAVPLIRNGQVVAAVCVARDITDRTHADDALRESEERFRRIFDEGPFGMNLTNPDHTIAIVNKAFCEMLGYTEQELTGHSIADITYEEDREKSRELTGQLFAGSIPMFRLEKRYVRKDGDILWANIAASAIHGKKGNVLYSLVIIQDLTEIKKAEEKIHLLHYYDSLTGLPNRTFHKELIKRSIEHAHRHKEKFAIIYIGLDNFQRINDTLGHHYGDLLLKAIADKLTNSLRESDYVARSGEGEAVDVVSRVGGDEFIVLAHDIIQTQDAAIASRRLLKEISEPIDLNGREVFLTASIGIALYPDDGTDVDDVLKNAEKAMRYTKSEGKNNYHFYSGSMNSFVLELLSLESDLHKALEREELVLYYQPKVDATTRVVTGMEALIRWVHPDKGLIPPMQFIPLAETSGLIIPIGEFVIRTVCRQIKAWQEAGNKQMSISLNVSSRQFDQQNLIEVFKAAIQDTMIPPQCLQLEITESTIMRNTEKAIRTLTELKAMGIGVAIDDFGTGYSSLSYLKRLPLDFLKIDMSFVKSLTSNLSDQAIVKATIAMAHSLNLKTIAEGVETEEQLSFLQKHGCDEIQGYLFGRPLPVDKITKI